MAHEIIFHHYPTSPFSEKIRLVFGIKRLSWRSVEIPNMMPKPDLVPLTGGYRKTPVMQIGADIFCDTQIIIRELERRHPKPSLFPYGKGLPYGLAFWADRIFFMPTVGVIFGAIGDMVPEDFKKDRAAMSGAMFSTEAMKATAPFMRDQFRAHVRFIADQLEDGRNFVLGAEPSADDIHAIMNLWFMKSALPPVIQETFAESPKVQAWFDRVMAFGHGSYTPMDAKEALGVAQAAISEVEPSTDRHDPSKRKPGDRVTVAADDYGRDPIAGELVFSDSHEIAIRRYDPQVGDVVVHFPRAGFTVTSG